MADKRKIARRDFTYYMQVTDDVSKQLIGYLTDISTGGFRLDCPKQIPAGHDFRMQIQLTPEIADKTSMVFIARSRWCHTDHVDPNTYNVGFEIIEMAASDRVIFQRMFDKYGSQNKNGSTVLPAADEKVAKCGCLSPRRIVGGVLFNLTPIDLQFEAQHSRNVHWKFSWHVAVWHLPSCRQFASHPHF